MEPPTSDELRRQIAALEEEVAAVMARAHAAQAELSALDEQRAEAEGRLSIARRAEADHLRTLEEQRAALIEAEREEARAVFADAVQRRDAAALEVADALRRAMEGLEQLDRARESVRAAAHAVSQREDAPVGIPHDPEVFEEQWERAVDVVHRRLSEQHEQELVEAAAQSPSGRAIEELPEHLQELARERRRMRLRAALLEDRPGGRPSGSS